MHDLHDELTGRFDEFGYGMFLAAIVFISVLIKHGHGWKITSLCFVLMFAVLELSYRLYAKS